MGRNCPKEDDRQNISQCPGCRTRRGRLQDGRFFQRLTVVTTVVPPEVPVKRRGRPKAGGLIEPRTEYFVEFQVTEPAPESIQAERERRTTLMLHTSNLALDARTAL